jgi:hypothetical protein
LKGAGGRQASNDAWSFHVKQEISSNTPTGARPLYSEFVLNDKSLCFYICPRNLG